MSEDSLLERVTAAAEERQLSQNSLLAYRRTRLKIIAWAAAEGLVLKTFPVDPRTRSRRVPARRGGRSQHAAAVDVREQCHGGDVVAIGELVTPWPPRHDG